MVGWPTFPADVGHPTMATGWVGPPPSVGGPAHSGMSGWADPVSGVERSTFAGQVGRPGSEKS